MHSECNETRFTFATRALLTIFSNPTVFCISKSMLSFYYSGHNLSLFDVAVHLVAPVAPFDSPYEE